jgi:hypothetical protein
MGNFVTVDLNDLPEYSEWIPRLIEGKEIILKKEINEIYREFEIEKWAQILRLLENEKITFDQIDIIEYSDKEKILISINDAFVLIEPLTARDYLAKIIAEKISKDHKNSLNIVELGAGKGSNIIRLARNKDLQNMNFYASDFSCSSVNIIKIITVKECLNIETFQYDFNNPLYSKLIPKNSIVFTSFSLAYVKNLNNEFWNNHKNNIIYLFEPIYQNYLDNKLINILRKKYFEINDYSKDILPSLDNARRSGILKYEIIETNILGLNPLCPISIIRIEYIED